MSTPSYWNYTTRCECCGEHIDYAVKKDIGTYEQFRRVILSMPLQSFKPCEVCERQTLQTLIAYSHQPDDKD